jgi:hypothetical protein
MKFVTGTASYGMIEIPSVTKIGRGIQAILRFYLNNLRGYSVDITDGRDL